MSENQENKGNIFKVADILFAQIENVSNLSAKDESFKAEISKANTIQKMADSYLKSAEIGIQGAILKMKLQDKNCDLPAMLEDKAAKYKQNTENA